MKTIALITRNGIAGDTFKQGERGIIDAYVQTNDGTKAVFIDKDKAIKLVPIYALRVVGFTVGGVLTDKRNDTDYGFVDAVEID